MKLNMQFFFKSETYDESLFAWFLGGQVLNLQRSVNELSFPIELKNSNFKKRCP